jgi:hypothetical protein
MTTEPARPCPDCGRPKACYWQSDHGGRKPRLHYRCNRVACKEARRARYTDEKAAIDDPIDHVQGPIRDPAKFPSDYINMQAIAVSPVGRLKKNCCEHMQFARVRSLAR